MSDQIVFYIDGEEVSARPGQTIMEAADEAGIYIPRLCWARDLAPGGACRVCTVLVGGRPQSACTFPASNKLIVENDTPQIRAWRKSIVEMLFVEGNHFCMFCEKSGNCELQGMGYRLGMTTPEYPYLFPERDVDATHPDVLVDRNRCILCGRCVRASRDIDGKNVFQFVGRGAETRIAVNSEADLGKTTLSAMDKAVEVCPVGAILRKRQGFATPIGERSYDHRAIGSDIEARRAENK